MFGEQDAGCVSYGVRLPGGERLFVKEAADGRGQRSLDRAWEFHRAVRHPVIVPQLHRIVVGGRRTAVVMPWHEGEILYDRAARARFRALDRILDAHLTVEAAGQFAVDLYDGAFLYDFGGHEIHSSRFMAPRSGGTAPRSTRAPPSTPSAAPPACCWTPVRTRTSSGVRPYNAR
ncbi:hypothetical protein ABZ896_23500 [Streptomyces sp. NPDC047072]|uniref:hypothetical protein n=1 Tax=Streptomyces sp. NPDC047072 TaxID=3154809 RepID=UPI00340BE4A6